MKACTLRSGAGVVAIFLASGLLAQEAAAPAVPAATSGVAVAVTTGTNRVEVPPVAAVTNRTAATTRRPASSALFLNTGANTNQAGMTITSERLEFDYKELVVAFDENVHVVDPQFSMTADRVLVFLEGTNQMKRIVSLGHVDMSQTDRHATCDKAVYDRVTGRVVMTGTPVLSRGNDRVTGTQITINLNDERVLVDGDARVLVSPETMKNRDVKP